MLASKWKTSVKEIANSEKAYQELSDALDNESVRKWEAEEREALAQGGDAMAIYGVRLEEGAIYTIPRYIHI